MFMKNFMITILLITIFQESNSQIFAQKKTRREFFNRLRALKVYRLSSEGYEIAKMASIQSMILSMEILICIVFF